MEASFWIIHLIEIEDMAWLRMGWSLRLYYSIEIWISNDQVWKEKVNEE